MSMMICLCPKCRRVIAEIDEDDYWRSKTEFTCNCGFEIELGGNRGGKINMTMDEIHPKDNVRGLQ